MNKQLLIDAFIKNPDAQFNISSKLRKEILLDNDPYFIRNGELHFMEFKNLSGGVYRVSCKKKNPTSIK